MKPDLSFCPVKRETAAFRVIENEAVILNLENGIYYSLNPVGTRLWELFDGKKSIRDLAQVLTEEYDVDPKTAEQDIIALVEDLLQEGLVAPNEV
jgi:hypothetical protein